MTSTTSTTDQAADRALKARHRAMWALGDYPAVAIDVIPELGPELVAAAGIRPATRYSTSLPAPETLPSPPPSSGPG